MNRETRSELLKISEEFRRSCEKVQALLHAEPNREAKELMSDALCCGTSAAEKTLMAVVIEDEPAAVVQSAKRVRKPRGAPDDDDAPPGQIRLDEQTA